MKKVITLTIIKDLRGKTCMAVLDECRQLVSALNTPAPFETVPDKPDMAAVATQVKEICDKATESVRVGYLSSSFFCVERNGDVVKVLVRNFKKSDTLFLLLEKLPQ
jgi:hypothetical protein